MAGSGVLRELPPWSSPSALSFSAGCVFHRFTENTEPLAILFLAQGQGLAHSLSTPGAQHEHHQSLRLNEWKPVWEGERFPHFTPFPGAPTQHGPFHQPVAAELKGPRSEHPICPSVHLRH